MSIIHQRLSEVEALLEKYREFPSLEIRNQIMVLLYPWLKRKVWWLMSVLYWKQAVLDQDVEDVLHEVCLASTRLFDRQPDSRMTPLQYLLGGCKWTIRSALHHRFASNSATEVSGLGAAAADCLFLKAKTFVPPPVIEDEPIQETKEIREAVENGIAHLCEGQELITYLRIIRGLSIQECAEELGLPYGIARNRIFRAKQTLQQSLLKIEAISHYARLPGLTEHAIKLRDAGLSRKIIRKRLGYSYGRISLLYRSCTANKKQRQPQEVTALEPG